MCAPSTVVTSIASPNVNGGLYNYIASLTDKSYVPANIFDATPFNARISLGYYIFNDNLTTPANTRYVYELTLPAGVTIVGSPSTTNWYNG